LAADGVGVGGEAAEEDLRHGGGDGSAAETAPILAGGRDFVGGFWRNPSPAFRFCHAREMNDLAVLP
jgi:hypothetical protein